MLKRFRSFRYALLLEGVVVGILSGLVTVVFRLLLEHAEELLQVILTFGREHLWLIAVWFLILALLSLAVTALLKWEPLISGSGIPQVEGELHGKIEQKWWRVLLSKLAGGLIAIGAGLSLGREGPSIQLGAMAGKGFSRLTRRMKTEEKMLVTCGAGAGLAAAFNAPLAGVLFTLEELHKDFSVEVLLSAMASCCTADFISRYVFGLTPVFQFEPRPMLPLRYYGWVVLLGVIAGLFGVIYNFCLRKTQDIYSHIRAKPVRILIPFLLAGVFGFTYPAVLGGGHSLVGQVNSGNMVWQALLLLLLLKFVFSMVSFGSGAPGGIFLPLLVMGAVCGGLFHAGVNGITGNGTDLLPYFVILGMAGCFSSIVRAPITGIILISEMTGSFSNLFTLSLISLVAYVTADLLHSEPVYDQLLHRLLKDRSGEPPHPTGEKLLVESPVCHGSSAEGKKICEIDWPENSLLVAITREGAEIVPKGDTVILAGDRIAVLCDEAEAPRVHSVLEQECSRVTAGRPPA